MSKVETRIKMVLAAIDLFHRQGVNATSIDQILEKSGTGKSQFSHYFKTKEGLVHATLEYLHKVIQDGKADTGYDVKTWRDMDRWFQSYIDFGVVVNSLNFLLNAKALKSCPQEFNQRHLQKN